MFEKNLLRRLHIYFAMFSDYISVNFFFNRYKSLSGVALVKVLFRVYGQVIFEQMYDWVLLWLCASRRYEQ